MSVNKFCSNCGEKISETEKFCHSCGSKLSEVENMETNIDNQQTPKINEQSTYNKKPKIACWILIGIGAFCILIGSLGLVSSSVDTVTSIGNIVIGLPLCIFGAALYMQRIQKYGWGIGIAILVGAMGNSLVDICVGGVPFSYHKSSIIGCFVLLIVFSCLLIKANIKKEK